MATEQDELYIAVYNASLPNSNLRQGEIVSNLIQVHFDLNSYVSTSEYRAIERIHEYAIIITQDCDLEQDFRARTTDSSQHRLLPNILFCEVELATELRYGSSNPDYPQDKQARHSKLMNSATWKAISQNKDERFHYFQKVRPDEDLQQEGLPELCLEFKRYFTVPTDEVYFRIDQGQTKRRCKLTSPYLEHLSSRFHYFHSRIALPHDHESD